MKKNSFAGVRDSAFTDQSVSCSNPKIMEEDVEQRHKYIKLKCRAGKIQQTKVRIWQRH